MRVEWWAHGEGVGVEIRDAVGHHWIRFCLSRTGRTQPGHRWMYDGTIRRDAWRIGGLGLIVMRMPRQAEAQATTRVLAERADRRTT